MPEPLRGLITEDQPRTPEDVERVRRAIQSHFPSGFNLVVDYPEYNELQYRIEFHTPFDRYHYTFTHNSLFDHICRGDAETFLAGITRRIHRQYEAEAEARRHREGSVRFRAQEYRIESPFDSALNKLKKSLGEGLFDGIFDDSNNKKRSSFNKKNPLKMQIKTDDKKNREEQAKTFDKIKFYKNVLNNDNDMPAKLREQIVYEIQRQRGRLKFNSKTCNNHLTLDYKGIKKTVPYSENGFVDKSKFIKEKRQITKDLRARRHKSRMNNDLFKEIEGIRYKTVGGVHTSEGSILGLYQQVAHRRVNSLRKPKSSKNHIGIEVEFFTNVHREDITQMLIDAKLSNNCRIMSDNSIRPTDLKPHGYELCILAEESEFSQIVERACDLLNDIEAEVNNSCGLHVHLDCRNRDKRVLYNNLYYCQDLLFSLVAPNRKESTYCRMQTGPDWDRASDNHYDAINRAAYSKHRTIEIRMHHGTTVARDIINWVNLLTKIANYDKKIEKRVIDPSEIKNMVKLEDSIYEHFETRYRLFGG